uniref:NADH-ubiquinone oxidoreductase chain 6 n=1 Tax=Rhagophthalmus giganteus TaxID=2591746 RepID=A0A5C0Q0F1_9COLE|nr:NADH dehydrogenase subunit 6 [Rhagophthalmus giganteus]
MSLIMMMTIMFSLMKHPMSMGFTLMIQTILIALITGLMSPNFWFSYIMFMVMIGGMLILLIYMTSVASNEKFKFNMKLTIIIMMMMLILIILMSMMSKFQNSSLFMNTDLLTMNKITNFKLSLNKFLNYPMNWLFLSLIIYLLMTLIAIVKITNTKQGPLRQKN